MVGERRLSCGASPSLVEEREQQSSDFGRLLLLTLVYFVLAKTLFPRLETWLYKEGS